MEIIKTASDPDSIFKSLLLVPSESREWKTMWNRLARHRLNKGLEDPASAENYGEVWEYMESRKGIFRYTHVFRHRLHPKTQSAKRLEIKSSFRLRIIANS